MYDSRGLRRDGRHAKSPANGNKFFPWEGNHPVYVVGPGTWAWRFFVADDARIARPTRSPYIPVNTRRLPNAGLMLGQRRRRWANIKAALGERLVFAGIRRDPHIQPCKAKRRYLLTLPSKQIPPFVFAR